MSRKKKLKTLCNVDIEQYFKKQHEEIGWSFYDERQFLENLFVQRLNYLIVAYSLFITAFASIDGKLNKLIILFLGLLITSSVSLTIFRAYLKLDIVFQILHKLPKHHVFRVIQTELDKKNFSLFNVNPILGWVIPILLALSFLSSIPLIYFDIWKFPV